MAQDILQCKVEIFPLNGVNLKSEVLIRDHINLSGKSPKEIGFIPITDLYVNESGKEFETSNDAIIVACLKDGVIPSDEETQKLKALGVSAYSYSLLDTALYAAAQKKKVKATGFVPSLPQGFKAVGLTAGIKSSKKKDLGIITSDYPCDWAGVFTLNKVRAICVEHNKQLLGKKVRAIVCNSGNANACTGAEGTQNDNKIRDEVAGKLGASPNEILSASTGKIGIQLDMDKINGAIKNFRFPNNELESINNFAQSMLTTDLKIKIYQTKNLIGFTKGSGMIHPNMATMLAFIVSDADIEGDMQKILQEVVDETFNCISVDGDVSTNDMVLLLTNRKGPKISAADFKNQLKELCKDLAIKIVLDGEGATKLIITSVSNAKDNQEARLIAKSVIGSSLAKCAMFGNDPNWGRILAAIGYSGASNVEANKITIKLMNHAIYENGSPTEFGSSKECRKKLSDIMKISRDIPVDIDMGFDQDGNATAWGSDLSYEYVRINAEYFT